MDTTNYCPLCEHYASSAERLNDENRTLRQRVEELERERDAAWAVRDAGWVQTEDALTRMRTAEARLARCVEALEPFIRRHCGLCVPVDEQGRMGEVTTESCVCDADQKQARAALAAAKGE